MRSDHSKRNLSYVASRHVAEQPSRGQSLEYGHDSHLEQMDSFQSLDDLAGALSSSLQQLCGSRHRDSKLKSRPLLLLGHSLGGFIIKKASTGSVSPGFVMMLTSVDAHQDEHQWVTRETHPTSSERAPDVRRAESRDEHHLTAKYRSRSSQQAPARAGGREL